MKNGVPCTDTDKEALVAYLYNECGAGEREQVEAHLTVCPRCADEEHAFRSVRGALDTWTLSEPTLGLRIVSERDALSPSRWRLGLRPLWGLAAAAVVVLGIGLALGGAEFRYVDDSLVFRVGRAIPMSVPTTETPAGRTDVVAPPLAELDPPWRTDLVALEDQLRREWAGAPVSADPHALLREVQGLISESEQRQQRERALWLTEFAQEVDMQRRADRQQMQRELGALEGYADYLVHVSQR
jgi:anti-sigma factor RsiW